MIDVTAACVGLLHDTLADITELVDIVGQEIHWKDAEDVVPLPYVIFHHIAGGFENETHKDAVDTYWKVVGVSDDKATSLNILSALGNLHKKELVITNNPTIQPYAPVRQFTPASDDRLEQGVRVFEEGGIYRLRFIIGE
jgi:hypothetical protein